jgi:hypothetical protein
MGAPKTLAQKLLRLTAFRARMGPLMTSAWSDQKLFNVIRGAVQAKGLMATAARIEIGLPALRVFVTGEGKTGIVRKGTRLLIEKFADEYQRTGGAEIPDKWRPGAAQAATQAPPRRAPVGKKKAAKKGAKKKAKAGKKKTTAVAARAGRVARRQAAPVVSRPPASTLLSGALPADDDEEDEEE